MIKNFLIKSKTNGLTIPADVKVVKIHRNCVEAVRPDGLTIFLDKDETLNRVKLTYPDKDKVMKFLALYRAKQIYNSYKRKEFEKKKVKSNSSFQKYLLSLIAALFGVAFLKWII